MVDAVRIGHVTATNKKALDKWLRHRKAATGGAVGLSGAGLEQAVMALAASHPDLVAIRGASA